MVTRPPAGTIPDEPGSYQFKDKRGRVIYVGKATSLRSRVGSYFVPSADLGPKKQPMLDIIVGFSDQISDQVFHIAANISGLTELGGIALDERNPDFFGDQFDDVRLADTGWAKHQDIVFNAADHTVDGITRILGVFNAAKVRTYFGGQNGFGFVLFDNVLIQVGNEIFRL